MYKKMDPVLRKKETNVENAKHVSLVKTVKSIKEEEDKEDEVTEVHEKMSKNEKSLRIQKEFKKNSPYAETRFGMNYIYSKRSAKSEKRPRNHTLSKGGITLT